MQCNIGKEKLRKHLADLNKFKSPEPDQLNPRVLKELADVIEEAVILISEKS